MEAPLLIKKGTRRPDFKHKSVKRVKHQLRKHATHTRTTRSGVVWNYSRSHLCCHTKARKWLIAMLMSDKVRMHAYIQRLNPVLLTQMCVHLNQNKLVITVDYHLKEKY